MANQNISSFGGIHLCKSSLPNQENQVLDFKPDQLVFSKRRPLSCVWDVTLDGDIC